MREAKEGRAEAYQEGKTISDANGKARKLKYQVYNMQTFYKKSNFGLFRFLQ